MCGLQDILNFYTCHDNWSRCIGYFHRSNNRIGIGTAKEKRRPFECHPIVIGTVKVDLRQVTCLHEQDVGYMTIYQSVQPPMNSCHSFLNIYMSWIYSVLTSTAAANNMGSSTKSRFVLEPRVVTKVPV